MKRAADYRASARDALNGKWGKSILVGLVAMLLGGATTSGGNFNINLNNSGSSGDASESITDIPTEAILIFIGVFAVIMAIVLVASIAMTFFSGIIETGYSKYNLVLIDGGDAGFNHLFGYFPRWKTLGTSALLRTLYVTLWSLLFIIPGIIAGYNYAMTPYILAEDPSVGPNEAIERSKRLMYGHRWQLFCLEFSFIGWNILCALSCGIGNIWLTPYRYAARADFYREISCTRPVVEFDVPSMPADLVQEPKSETV